MDKTGLEHWLNARALANHECNPEFEPQQSKNQVIKWKRETKITYI